MGKENKQDYFTPPFHQKVRLGYCADPWHLRIYAHDGSNVLEGLCNRGTGTGDGYYQWKDQVLLPMGTGTAKIRENFIALIWPENIDNMASEVHLFSTKNGMLYDYSVGEAPGGVYSLVKPQCE